MMSLRPYQEKAKEAVLSEWQDGRRKTLLVLPTGTGKTIVFASVTEDMVRAGKRVLILAHRGELLDQAADKLQRATGLGCAVERRSSPASAPGIAWWSGASSPSCATRGSLNLIPRISAR